MAKHISQAPQSQEVQQVQEPVVLAGAQAPVPLAAAALDTQAQEGNGGNAPKKGGPFIAIGICLLALGIAFFAMTQLPQGDTGSAGTLSMASAEVSDAERIVVELTAEDVLAQSTLADTLFVSTEHRDLTYEGSYTGIVGTNELNDTQAYAGLAITLGAIEDDDFDVAITLIDIETGATFYYNEEEAFYSASSIKGPYVCCLYETLVESGEVSLADIGSYARPIIEQSDNVAYANLRRRFGGDEFETWLAEVGCTTGEYETYDEMGEEWYVHIGARQLAEIWMRCQAYLSSDTEASEILRTYFEEREYSALKSALGEEYITWGKAGWYPERDGSAWPATVDAGVVWAEHPYVVVVMSNIPDNMSRLEPVFSALNELHEGLYLLGSEAS